MRLLADECCDAGFVAALRADGHDVLFAIEELRGAPDAKILQRALDEERVLVTEDKDFGELVYRLRKAAHGIVLLKFTVEERQLKIPRMQSLLAQHAGDLVGAFTVLEPDKIRLRLLKD